MPITDFNGFESGYSTSMTPGIIDAITSGATYSAGTAGARSGARGLRVTHTGASQQAIMRHYISGTGFTFVGYFRIPSLYANETEHFSVEYNTGGAAQYARWGVDASGYLYADFYDGGDQDRVTASGFGTISANTWYRFEAVLDISGTTHTIDWGVAVGDDPKVAQSTVSYADGSAGNTTTEFGYGSLRSSTPSGFIVDVDDIAWYVASSGGYLGPVSIRPMSIVGTGTYNLDASPSSVFYYNAGAGDVAIANFDDSDTVLDDPAGAIGTDYVLVKGSPAGDEYVEYVFSAPPMTGNRIRGVKPIIVWANGAAGTSDTAASVAWPTVGLTDAIASGDPGAGTTLRYKGVVLTAMGGTLDFTDWDLSDIRLRWGYAVDISPEPRLHKGYIEVLYAAQAWEEGFGAKFTVGPLLLSAGPADILFTNQHADNVVLEGIWVSNATGSSTSFQIGLNSNLAADRLIDGMTLSASPEARLFRFYVPLDTSETIKGLSGDSGVNVTLVFTVP